MAILRLIGAKRFMNRKASPNVIELNGLTEDIKDEKLIKALLEWKRVDKDKKEYPMFELYTEADPVVEEPVTEEPEVEEPEVEAVKEEVEEPEVVEEPKPPAKKKAAKKKAGRTRSRAKAT